MISQKKVTFRRKLLGWYDRARRDLPWRAPRGQRPDPYHVLVSEAMLQQTQVATVIPYFGRFITRLPTLRDLAAADEQTVLLLWQGLGYYSRARNLWKAARQIVERHDGAVPETVDELLALPGIGPYSAGAIASIAFDRRAPLVDGNVARVLCRLERIETPPRVPATWKRLWKLADDLLPTRRCGDFNSALMELGATLCTPRSPKCQACPVAEFCKARAGGAQERIPLARKSNPTPQVRRIVLCLHRGQRNRARWLIEQRPPRGRWAGLWQFVTVPPPPNGLTPDTVAALTGVRVCPIRQVGTIQHLLTHRRYQFEVYAGRVSSDSHTECGSRRWVRLDELSSFPLSRVQLRIVQMLRRE